MVRRFTDKPVPRQSIERILGNAVRGPSAVFSQGQAFLVLTGDDLTRFWTVAGEPIGAIAVGYDADAGRNLSARRRPLEQMVHYGRW